MEPGSVQNGPLLDTERTKIEDVVVEDPDASAFPQIQASVDTETLIKRDTPADTDAAHFEKAAAGKMSFPSSVFNLTNTILGSGLLSIAYSFRMAGWIEGLVLLAAFAALAYYTLTLEIDVAYDHGCSCYESLAHHAYGTKGSTAVSTFIILQCLGTLSALLSAFGDNLSAVLDAWWPEPSFWTTKTAVVILATILVTFPVSMFRTFNALRYASVVSISCIALVTLLAVFTYFDTVLEPGPKPYVYLQTFRAPDLNLFDVIPTYIFAYVCHVNVLPISYELADATPKRRHRVALYAIIGGSVVYVGCGLFGYFTFGELTHPDFLINFPSALPVVKVVQLVFPVACMLTFPLIVNPFRRSTERIFFHGRPFTWTRHTAETILANVAPMCFAIWAPTIQNIFSLFGAIASPNLSIVLPGLIYWKSFRHSPHTHLRRKALRVGVGMTGLGVLVSVSCTILAVLKLAKIVESPE